MNRLAALVVIPVMTAGLMTGVSTPSYAATGYVTETQQPRTEPEEEFVTEVTVKSENFTLGGKPVGEPMSRTFRGEPNQAMGAPMREGGMQTMANEGWGSTKTKYRGCTRAKVITTLRSAVANDRIFGYKVGSYFCNVRKQFKVRVKKRWSDWTIYPAGENSTTYEGEVHRKAGYYKSTLAPKNTGKNAAYTDRRVHFSQFVPTQGRTANFYPRNLIWMYWNGTWRWRGCTNGC